MCKRLEHIPPKEDTQMANKYMNSCSHHQSLGKWKLIARTRYHYIAIRMAKIKNSDNMNADKGMEQLELLHMTGTGQALQRIV